MFKAIHSYKAVSPNNTLSFNKGDIFCILEETNNSWWLASNKDGKVGYVPKSYLTGDTQVNSTDAVVKSIDRAIATVYTAAGGNFTQEQQSMLKKLSLHKQKVIASQSESKRKESVKRQAPPPPAVDSTIDQKGFGSAPSPPQRTLSVRHGQESVKQLNPSVADQSKTGEVKHEQQANSTSNIMSLNDAEVSKIHVPVELGETLMTIAQSHCGLPPTQTRTMLLALLSSISNEIHPLSRTMQEIIDVLPQPQTNASPLMDTLGLAFANLGEIKDDAQQRNWAIEDDQGKISDILSEILTLISSEEREECLKVLSDNDYTPVLTLAFYYQMEPRVPIRLLALQVLAVVCSVSSKCISVLLGSVLPNELAREIRDHVNDIDRTCYSALVLSMVFSTGEPVPISYYDSIGYQFLSFVLSCIEDGIPEDVDDKVGDIFVRLALAINLHFVVPSENLLLKAVMNRSACTSLSEKIMLLVNRGDDPVLICEDQFKKDVEPSPNSVLKFLQDVFSMEDTAISFLYTNDLLVLIDIIVRNVTDLLPGSKSRTDYLDLLLNVVTNSSYKDEKHRNTEILALLYRIRDEEKVDDVAVDSVIDFDKTIVANLLPMFEGLST